MTFGNFREDWRTVIILLAVLAMILFWRHEAHAQDAPDGMGYYIEIQPVANGPTAYIGPWKSLAAARDVDGSMLYSHPFACHITGPHPPSNCRNTGNGIAYPAGQPYLPAHQIPSSDAVLLPTATTPGQAPGWYRLYYANDGTPTVFPRAQNRKYRALVRSHQGTFTEYKNVGCPGWPFFLVGKGGDGAGDGACD